MAGRHVDQLRSKWAWRTTSGASLPEVFRTVAVPKDARLVELRISFENPDYVTLRLPR